MTGEYGKFEEWLKGRPGMEDRLMQSIVDEIAKECYRWNRESDYRQLAYKIRKCLENILALGHCGAAHFVDNNLISECEEITETQ